MQIDNSSNHYFPHQQGIALIIALGVLSVMLIMAVSFAISMRTERVAAGNSLDSVKANQLIRSALAVVMADLHQRLHLVERESCSVDTLNSQIVVSNAALYPTGLQIGLHNVLWTNHPIYSIYRSSNRISIASTYDNAINGIQIDLSGYSPDDIGEIIKRMNIQLETSRYGNNNDTLIVSGVTNYKTTAQITLLAPMSVLPQPLSDGTYYIFHVNSNNIIKVAQNYSDYTNGLAIDITSSGSGINMVGSFVFTADPATDELTVNGTIFPANQVMFSRTGFLPPPLTANQCYFVINVSATQIQLADSFENAVLGNSIDYYDIGTGTIYIIQTGYPYPPWSAIASYSTNSASSLVSLTNNALNYIPSSLTSAVAAVDAACRTNYWINIEAVANGEATTVGRVAYLIANCSGLLDANFVGGSNRVGGTHPAEIEIGYLDEIDNESSFITYRDANKPFESLPSLAGWQPAWHPANMFYYSRFVENQWNTNLLDVDPGKCDLAGDEVYLESIKKDIINAFWLSGLTKIEAATAFTNLLDYVDGDSYPRDLHASVEAVPLINEIMFYNTVTIVNTTNYYLTNSITVELWYPFSSTNLNSFTFDLKTEITAVDHQDFMPPAINGTYTFTSTPTSFRSLVGTQSKYVQSPPVPLLSPGEQLIWTETINTAAVTLAGIIVDQLDNPLVCTITSTIVAGTNFFESRMSKECVDPRFNWDPDSGQWGSWLTNTYSINNTNWITKAYWSSNPYSDSNAPLSIANQVLQSLSELTYLIYSVEPWTTIRVGGVNPHNVYDYFALRWFDLARGYVNPNTHIRDVLATAFYDVPAGAGTTSESDAQIIANEIINGKGLGYMTIDDVIAVILNSAAIPGYIDKNALIDNTENLLNLRQNLFAVIIEAHVASGGNIPVNPAKQRALALIWRDPFRDEYYVRSLIFF